MSNQLDVVLVIDPDHAVQTLIKLELAESFRILTDNGKGCILDVPGRTAKRPNLVILDAVKLGLDAEEFLNFQAEFGTPVIVLSAGLNDVGRAFYLNAGADDCLTKPFSPSELAARVRSITRRYATAGRAAEVVEIGNIRIDLTRRQVKKDGQIVGLTRTEWQLLQFLAANQGRVLLNRELLVKVWGPEYSEQNQYLRTWMSRLRQKLEDKEKNPKLFNTLTGIGYMLGVPGTEPDIPCPTKATGTALQQPRAVRERIPAQMP